MPTMTRSARGLLLVSLTIVILCLPVMPCVAAGSDGSVQTVPGLAPDNTVILANRVDARFGRDYSVLLKQLQVEWVIVNGPSVPDAVREKNVILVGNLESPYTGEIMREILTEGDIELVHAADGPVVLERDSPWAEARSVFVCIGADSLSKRNAAEEAVRAIMARSRTAFAWIRTRFDASLDEDVYDYVDYLRFSWDDAELPLTDLMMDVDARPRGRISAQQAAEDVERLFYLFSHGYAGYAFFNEHGEFAAAKERILAELSSEPQWSNQALSGLFYEQLSFITDCHLRIGEYQFAGHADFWYDTSLQVVPAIDGYQVTIDNAPYTLVSINGEDPEGYVFPSLNAQGEPVYRVGVLSKVAPEPLLLVARSDTDERHLAVELQRSDYDYYSNDIFREDSVGGIPVIRVRSFGDVSPEALGRFVETGSAHRGEPVIVVDVRGNGGGNEAWPISWIKGLTGQRAESVFIFSELHNKTTMAGRANVFADLHEAYPGIESFGEEAERHTSLAESYESRIRQPDWEGPYYPQMSLIPNETTLIIVMNNRVASAGEGLIMRSSRAENVMLVGENSRGCLTFGNSATHQLPHSKITVSLPINFGLYLDMEFREEKGIAPDLWVPAADAVNYAVAAVRSGTISTYQPLSSSTLRQQFVPESPWARVQREGVVLVLLVALIIAALSAWAYFMRKRPLIVALAGVVWLVFGSIWLLDNRPGSLGFLLGSVICLVSGGISLLRTRLARTGGPR